MSPSARSGGSGRSHRAAGSPDDPKRRTDRAAPTSAGLLGAVREEVRGHAVRGAREAASKARILALLDWLPDPLDQHRDPCHVTGSAIVVDADGRVLLHRHKRLGIWLQPGGHLDAGEHPAEAAVRETAEETGLDASPPTGAPELLHVDVHEGPRGHLHLDLRYLLSAAGDNELAPAPGESPEVAWFTRREAARLADGSLRAALKATDHRSRLTG